MPMIPQQPLSAERVYETLKAAHQQLQVDAATAGDDLPAWYLLTAAGPIRIRTINTYRQFVQFVTPEGHIVLIAPDAVAVTMEKLTPESSEPRFPIGFPSHQGEERLKLAES